MALETSTTISGKQKPNLEALTAQYADKKEIDDGLDKLLKINLKNCGDDLWRYNERQEKLLEKLAPALEDPATLKQALFRHGLPENVRMHAAFYQEQIDPNDPSKVAQVDMMTALYDEMGGSKDEEGKETNPAPAGDATAAMLPPPTSTSDQYPSENKAVPAPNPKRKRPAPNAPLPSEDGETSNSSIPLKTKKRKKANAAKGTRPVNVRKLAKEKQTSGSKQDAIKDEKPDNEAQEPVHHLGPDMPPVVITWPYLVDFASTAQSYERVEMNVANKPQLKLMAKIIADIVTTYARSRSNLATKLALLTSHEHHHRPKRH